MHQIIEGLVEARHNLNGVLVCSKRVVLMLQGYLLEQTKLVWLAELLDSNTPNQRLEQTNPI